MRTLVKVLLLAACAAGCSSKRSAGDVEAATEAGAGAATDAAPADAGPPIACADAPSLDAACCVDDGSLYAACPRDFASIASICGVTDRARVFLRPAPCGGFVFADVLGVDTGYVFAFDAASGALRAVFYGGGATFGCVGAADPSIAIPSACVDGDIGRDPCDVGGETRSAAFDTYCATRPEGDPRCPTAYGVDCAYPTTCVAGRCVVAPRDGG